MTKPTKDNILLLLEDALQSHDWFHHMSDSASPYQQGKAELAHIKYLVSLASSFNLGEEAKTMHAKYYNEMYLQKINKIRTVFPEKG
jgi:hypothetical protein